MSGRRALAAAAVLTAVLAAGGAQPATAAEPHPVIELRQYHIVQGHQDEMMALFDRWFVDSQEQLGMRLVGQFRDLDDPDRFTWIRAFPEAADRDKLLSQFYFGPVWAAHRGEANPLLDDNDNVLLLRPSGPGRGFPAPAAPRAQLEARPAKPGLVVAEIFYLWKRPDEGFTAFFHDRLAPAYAAAGLPVVASYVPQEGANSFPRLPIRDEPRLFVWFTRAADAQAYRAARTRLESDPRWRSELVPQLARFGERAPQVLRLEPGARSLLR